MNPTNHGLVTPEWLHEHLNDPSVRVLDATTWMTPQPVGPSQIKHGGADWQAGHIPGSQHVCMVSDFSNPDGAFPYTLPTREQVEAKLSALGIQSDTHIVIYTAAQPMVATRVWWVLWAWGHERVSVLNGGLPLWRSQGRPLTTEPFIPTPSHYSAAPTARGVADADAVRQAIDHPSTCLINALSAPQFDGSGGAHYGRPGRIPSSVNVPASACFEPETMIWKSDTELRDLFRQQGLELGSQQHAITYCGGGIAASVAHFALTHLGHPQVSLYDHSLLQWANDNRLPMVTG